MRALCILMLVVGVREGRENIIREKWYIRTYQKTL